MLLAYIKRPDSYMAIVHTIESEIIIYIGGAFRKHIIKSIHRLSQKNTATGLNHKSDSPRHNTLP